MADVTFIEKRILSKMISGLRKQGWSLAYVNDGQEIIRVKTAKAAQEAVFAVDEARVAFQNADGRKHSVLLVGGNGVDFITDYSYSETDNFDAAMDAILEQISTIYG